MRMPSDAQLPELPGLSATLEADAKGPSSQARHTALVDLSRLQLADVSMADGCRFLHQCTPTPRGRSLRTLRRKRWMCLRQINDSRGNPVPHLR